MGLLSFLTGNKKKHYIKASTPATSKEVEKKDSAELIRARAIADEIIAKNHCPKALPTIAETYAMELHAYNASGERGSQSIRAALTPLCKGTLSDLSQFRLANEMIDRFDTEIYEYTAVDETGISRTVYYSKDTDRPEIKMAIDFLGWEHATVQMVADHYHVSRSTASNKLKGLKTTDYVLWKNVQDRLDTNKCASLAKASEARKKKSDV